MLSYYLNVALCSDHFSGVTVSGWERRTKQGEECRNSKVSKSSCYKTKSFFVANMGTFNVMSHSVSQKNVVRQRLYLIY